MHEKELPNLEGWWHSLRRKNEHKTRKCSLFSLANQRLLEIQWLFVNMQAEGDECAAGKKHCLSWKKMLAQVLQSRQWMFLGWKRDYNTQWPAGAGKGR